MEKNSTQWLLYSYKAPSDPSTLRVRIWRTLKALGVLYIQQSVCVVPNTQDVRKKIRKLEILIRENRGESQLIVIECFSKTSEETIIQQFNTQRDHEYTEFMEEAIQFLNELKKETDDHNFTYREVEENDAELLRLKRWYRKIKRRDFFQSSLSQENEQMLVKCEDALNAFTEKVYFSEGALEGKITGEDNRK